VRYKEVFCEHFNRTVFQYKEAFVEWRDFMDDGDVHPLFTKMKIAIINST